MSAYDNLGLDLGSILTLAVNGSNKRCYVMSLGISPYITASLVVTILYAMRSKEAKARTSPKAMNYWITAFTFIVTLVQSIFYALGLKYIDRNIMSILVAIFELMAADQSGHQDEVLKTLSNRYKEDLERMLSSFLNRLEPSMIAGLSLLVGFLLISIMLPLMNVLQTLG